MKTYDEMKENVFRRRDEYFETKRKVMKKTSAIIFSTAIVVGSCFAVYGVSEIIKEKNKFQIAHESGSDISEVDEEGNFKYEDFSSLESDMTDDPKINIYNKMLNTIDFIDRITVTAETSMLGEGKCEIFYDVDITEGISYQSVRVNGTLTDETFSTNKGMTYVDHNEKYVCENYLPTYSREDTPYIPLSKRIVTGDDGIPCYYYRRNITNCPLASYCLVPQELTFSYLKDFDLWKIEDNYGKYLERECIVIKGILSPYSSEKHSADSFVLQVDKETGIILSLETMKNGAIVDYMRVMSYNLDSLDEILKYNEKEFNSYNKIAR